MQLRFRARRHAARQARDAERSVRQDSAEAAIWPSVVGLSVAMAENAGEGTEMLLRKHLRRRHQRALETVRGGCHEGQSRNDRLAAADIALQEAHHRGAPADVRQYLLHHAALVCRQREGQGGQHVAHGLVAAWDRRAELPLLLSAPV